MNTQQALQLAFQHLNSGNLMAAHPLFNSILQREPQNFAALNGRGFIALQQNQLPQALVDLQQSLSVNPKQAFSQKMVGIVLGAMGRFDESMAAFAAALALDSRDPEVYFNRANFRFQAGQAQEALADLDAAIKLRGSYLEARSNRANLLIQLGDFARAEKDLDYLATKVTNNPDIWVALGLARHKVGKHKESMPCNERALKLVPNHPDALLNSSSAMYDQGDYPAALAWADKAIAATPNRAEAHYAKAQALMAMHHFDEAIASYSRAIELNPNYAEAYMGRGLTRARLRELDAAAADCQKAAELTPKSYEAVNSLGSVFIIRGEYSSALKCFQHARSINPHGQLAVLNEARALAALKSFDDAKTTYTHALKMNPNARWLYGEYMFTLASTCDWAAFEEQCDELLLRVRAGETACTPFSIVATSADLQTRKICSQTYSKDKFSTLNSVVPIDWKRSEENRLTVAYLSSDFFEHATSQLIVELFELHNRSRFNVFGVCYGKSPNDKMRARVSSAFDQFYSFGDKSDKEIAGFLRGLGVDIAIDLKGHTKDSRLGIFAERIAPVQMHYLGYPGTTGAPFIDYLIADETLVPEAHVGCYTEKIVFMPDSYQVNDRQKRIANVSDTRLDHGLPRDSFVFCCFNNNWKITADLFDVWMRILKRVEGSVLWLLADNESASARLKDEAVARGVCAARLVFAKRAPLDEHLARHAHADLFLDTFYCNAHTTASDALWAGLPLITKVGDAFASRVAASLLKAAGIDELITETTESYEALALDLAANRDKLDAVKRKLREAKNSSALFDTPRFTRNIESAYEAAWSRYQAGLPPEHIYIKLTG